MCVGGSFAMFSLRILLPMIVQRVGFELVPDSRISRAISGTALVPKYGIPMRLLARARRRSGARCAAISTSSCASPEPAHFTDRQISLTLLYKFVRLALVSLTCLTCISYNFFCGLPLESLVSVALSSVMSRLLVASS